MTKQIGTPKLNSTRAKHNSHNMKGNPKSFIDYIAKVRECNPNRGCGEIKPFFEFRETFSGNPASNCIKCQNKNANAYQKKRYREQAKADGREVKFKGNNKV